MRTLNRGLRKFLFVFSVLYLTLIFVRAEKKPRIHGHVLGEREIRAAANARSLIFKVLLQNHAG